VISGAQSIDFLKVLPHVLLRRVSLLQALLLGWPCHPKLGERRIEARAAIKPRIEVLQTMPPAQLIKIALTDCVFHVICKLIWSYVEVDFIVNDLECAIECKSSERVHDHHLKGLRELKKEHPKCRRRILVSRESVSRKTADGIEVLSVGDFLENLWDGTLF
jgi:hypothetical protein